MSAFLSSLIPAKTNALGTPKQPDAISAAEYNAQSLSSYMYGRYWSVAIGTPGHPGALYTQLRVEFDIEKTSASTSNKAKVKVYNLSSASRDKYVKGQLLTLTAGYQGLYAPIFSGLISSRVANVRKGGDIATIFECGEGEQPLYYNVFDRSYGAGTTLVQVLNDLVAALGLPLASVRGVPLKTYGRGVHITGSVKRNLDRILGGLGAEWSVQNGAVYIQSRATTNGQTAILITDQNAMIGTPTKSIGGTNIVAFSTLLNPNLFPGVPVQMLTAVFKGLFKILTAKLEGDSHGDQWTVACECIPISPQTGAQQNIGGTIQ